MSAQFQIPRALLAAIVSVESGGDAAAWNPEPPYRYYWDVSRRRPFREVTAAELASEVPPADFPFITGARDTEWWGQAASWGPMQVMGAVARELGFAGHFPGLCAASAGIEFGARHLVNLRRRWVAERGWAGVVAAYNAGSPRTGSDGRYVNQSYVDKVAAAFGGTL